MAETSEASDQEVPAICNRSKIEVRVIYKSKALGYGVTLGVIWCDNELARCEVNALDKNDEIMQSDLSSL